MPYGIIVFVFFIVLFLVSCLIVVEALVSIKNKIKKSKEK